MNISQRIPNLLAGISQQPDNRKRPGQVKDAKNVFPDYALGMLKRPGGQFVSQLIEADAADDNLWFHILRDGNEKYVVQYGDNRFNVWSLIDGQPRAVDMGNNTGVPGTCNVATLTTRSNELREGLIALATETTDLRTVSGDLKETQDGQDATTARHFTITNEFDNGVIDSTVRSGVTLDADGRYTVTKNGTVEQSKVTSITGAFSAGSERTDEYPLIASQGLRLFELHEEVAATHDAADLTAAEDAYEDSGVGALPDYNTAQTNVDTDRDNWETAFDNCAIPDADVPTDHVDITTPGSGFTDGNTPEAAQGGTAPVSGVTGGVFDITVASGEIDAATIVTDPGYHDGDVIQLAGFAGAELTFDRGAYLDGATAADIKTLTLNDTTYILNTAKSVRMTNTRSTSGAPRACGVIKVATFNTKYTVSISQGGTLIATGEADIGSTVTGDELSPLYVAEALRDDFNSNAAANTVNARRSGGVILFENDAGNSSTDPLVITISGGSGASSVFGFSETVASSVDLPESCENNYIVKVVNSSDIDVDDMYVKFETDGAAARGFGVWSECAAPDIEIEFDPLTMPHQLVRNADGSFTYGPVNWDNRLIGDNTTNPIPSFVDAKITGIVFHRNRLGFLSNDNVVFSRSGDITNFWVSSSLTGIDSDPIDISTSGNQPAVLTHGIPTAIGMVLYSSTEQFLLTTDSDVFSPTSTVVKTLSTYDAATDVQPVSLGTTQGFISKTPLYSKFFELLDINIEQPPVMNDTTVTVPELLPRSIDISAVSSDLSLVAFATQGSRDVYMFRFLNEGRNQRTIQTWFQWELTGTVLDQFFDGGTYYAITSNGAEVVIQKFDVSQSNESGFLTLPTGEQTDVCLDMFYVNPHRTYNETDDETTITLPYDHVDGNGNFTVVALGGYLGDAITAASAETVGKVITEDHDASPAYVVTHTADPFGDTFVIDGDYRGLNIIIGYQYDMQIDLPKLYVFDQAEGSVKYDNNADLIIHRLKVSTGLSGPVDYLIDIRGLEQFNETLEVAEPYIYTLNSVNMQSSATHEVPIYQRNENLSLSIKSTGPFPVSLLGYDWEGRYNTRFYRRK